MNRKASSLLMPPRMGMDMKKSHSHLRFASCFSSSGKYNKRAETSLVKKPRFPRHHSPTAEKTSKAVFSSNRSPNFFRFFFLDFAKAFIACYLLSVEMRFGNPVASENPERNAAALFEPVMNRVQVNPAPAPARHRGPGELARLPLRNQTLRLKPFQKQILPCYLRNYFLKSSLLEKFALVGKNFANFSEPPSANGFMAPGVIIDRQHKLAQP